jgi:hypothetical protein
MLPALLSAGAAVCPLIARPYRQGGTKSTRCNGPGNGSFIDRIQFGAMKMIPPRLGPAWSPDASDPSGRRADRAAVVDTRPFRASRRLGSLSEDLFGDAFDSRPLGRRSGVLMVVRHMSAADEDPLSLAEACARAVRPDDILGRIWPASVAIWLEGLPAASAELRAERLRLALVQQGIRDVEIVAFPIGPRDKRTAASLLTIAATSFRGIGLRP